jgi:CheY-like chemotaxis protein/chromosome segregation ATPase
VAERGPGVQGRGVLTALRAAAIVIIATGLNDVIAGAVPSYEPFYLYLAAIALVVWLDGVILGAITATVCLGFDALLFVGRGALGTALWLPAIEAVATVILIGVIRGLVRARRRDIVDFFPAPLPLLAAPVVGPADNSEVLSALAGLRGELRQELRAAVSELSPATDRGTFERELGRVREDWAERLRAADDDRARLARELADDRARLATARGEAAVAHEQIAVARAETSNALARLEAAARQGEVALREDVVLHQRFDAARAENDSLRNEIGRLRGAVEAAHSELTARMSDITALSAAADELRRAGDVDRGRADGERTLRMTAVQRVTELERTLETERTARAQAEQGNADERALRERLELDGSTRDQHAGTLRARIEELEQSLAEVSAAAADREQALRDRMAELEQSLAASEAGHAETASAATALHLRIAELEQALGREHEARAAETAAFDQKLATIVNHLAEDHETDLGKAVEEREAARAESRSLTLRLEKMQKKFEEDHDLATRLLGDTRTGAQREIERLRARVGELEGKSAAVVPAPPPPVRKRVLIAHPDADLRTSARASLERAGYDVLSAADGLDALRTAIAQRPDVVIADAVMPKMDGRELCQLLKSQEKTAHIRVILLTRPTDDPPKGDLLPDEVLRKPVPLETLKTTLAAMLGTTGIEN